MVMQIEQSKIFRFFFFLIYVGMASSCGSGEVLRPGDKVQDSGAELNLPYHIPPGGNSWVVNDVAQNEQIISDDGIHNWTDLNSVIRTWFKTNSNGKIHVGLNVKSPDGKTEIKVTVGNESMEKKIINTAYKNIEIGEFDIDSPGYNYIEIQGLKKSSNSIGNIKEVLIGGPATQGGVTYVKDDFYFGRRGPSVHLSYEMPPDKDIVWFYNEITVPEGEDVPGSYFMANGFAEGYFGIQVNSGSERRVLFSVWSPYQTQDPNEIPDDYKIILMGKGQGVTTGEFGNEGSGGQSYKVFDWKAGNTYKFLLKGEPSENNSTDYTAYFYAPEENEWQLIASFRRPHTNTYLTRLHSFLENFRTETGFIPRKGKYSNQWAYDKQGNWHELTKARLTADATAMKNARLDYEGGTEGDVFFMKNCGFFNSASVIGSDHVRQANKVQPEISFSQLEVPKMGNPN